MKAVTHSGTFHYDELLATAVLQHIYDDLEVTRSRDSAVINGADIVYDVGGVFMPEKKRFDHHQKSFTETYSAEYDTKLSSAGLIYKYYCDKLFAKYNFDEDHELFAHIKKKIYHEFFWYADALDNGVTIATKIPLRTVGSLVAGFNVYNCKNESELEALQNSQFLKALEIVKIDFINYCDYIFNDYAKKYSQVAEELREHEGEIYITRLSVPTSLILTVDAALGTNLKYVIYTNKNEYRMVALPVEQGSFVTKAPLKAAWRGLQNEELCKVSGIEGCIFVHATGFTGGNKTLKGAIAMCEASLEECKRFKA